MKSMAVDLLSLAPLFFCFQTKIRNVKQTFESVLDFSRYPAVCDPKRLVLCSSIFCCKLSSNCPI